MALLHGILGQPRETVLALLPSLTLLLSSLVLISLRGRRSRSVSVIGAGLALSAILALYQRLPSVSSIALWRPSGLFDSGFLFRMDDTVWPFMLLGSAVVLSKALHDGRSAMPLVYGALALAAIAAGNLLTLTMLWTSLIVLETALRLTARVDLGRVLSTSGAQFVGVLAAMAAGFLGEEGMVLLGLAMLIRSLGGMGLRSASSLSVLAPLGAIAAISRFSSPTAALPWIAGTVILVGLVQSLFYKSRLSLFALALTAAGFMAPPAARTAVWVAVAAVLVATVGFYHANGFRFGWVSVAAIPFAFLAAPSGPVVWIIATLSTTALAAISGLQSRSGEGAVRSRLVAGSIVVLFAAAALALSSSGWLPNLSGAVAAGLGLVAGYAIGRAHPTIIKARLPTRLPIAAARRLGGAVLNSLAAGVRTTADVLEGESAVLWILLVLLIVIIGLQVA